MSLVPTPQRRAAGEAATDRYAEAIELAGKYLATRGISEDVAVALRFGVVDDPFPGDEQFAGRLHIPYLALSGWVGSKYRCLEDHSCKQASHARYLSSPGFTPRLYNVTDLHAKNDVIAIVEGEIDAATVSHIAGIPAVGCPGVSMWQPYFNRLFAGHPRIIVIADGDDPGVDFARSLVDGNGRRDLPPLEGATLIRMPTGDDSNSFIVREGTNAFRAKLGLD